MQKSRREIGEHYSTLVKRDLKVEWVNDETPPDSIFNDKQAIIYVNSHNNVDKQVISIISEHIKHSFVETVKYYLTPEYNNASDCIMVKKIIKYSRPSINNYFNKTFLPKSFERSPAHRIAYDALVDIDKQGMFFPILINELNKYANRVYPDEPDANTEKHILEFMDFILKISRRKPREKAETFFKNAHICINITLALSELDAIRNDISRKIEEIDNDIKNGAKTIYILGAGSKISFATAIKDTVCEKYIDILENPIETEYYLGSTAKNTRAVCYELILKDTKF